MIPGARCAAMRPRPRRPRRRPRQRPRPRPEATIRTEMGLRFGRPHTYIGPVVSSSRSCGMGSPRDLADRMARRRKPGDGFLRETFTLPRETARAKARDFLQRYPKAGYMSAVES